MNEPAIIPITPWFETTDGLGRKCSIVAYDAEQKLWVGYVDCEDSSSPDWWRAWSLHKQSPLMYPETRLASYPPIPEVPREPKVGEVWADEDGDARLLISYAYPPAAFAFVSLLSTAIRQINGPYTVDRSELAPWPAEKPHGFEKLISAIKGSRND